MDDLTDVAETGDEPVHGTDACPPLLFMDEVTLAVDALVRAVSVRGASGGTVVIATKGGKLSAAQGFWSWLRRFPSAANVSAVATGPIDVPTVAPFLAFDRRSVRPRVRRC